ncbi:hypothetical protein Gasu2_29150 [Galdieria sulphuraria]|nr:hypothetical protein Gasu2_29150 [Galdieria sulphuraria]
MISRNNNTTCVYFLFRCSYTLATAVVSIWIVQNSIDLNSIRSVFPFFTNKYLSKVVQTLRNIYFRALSNKEYTIRRRNFYVISFSCQEDGQGLKLHSLSELTSQNPHRPKRNEQELNFKKQSRLQEREKYAKELNSDKLQQLEQELTTLKAQIQQFRALQTREEFQPRNDTQLNFWQSEE